MIFGQFDFEGEDFGAVDFHGGGPVSRKCVVLDGAWCNGGERQCGSEFHGEVWDDPSNRFRI